MKIIARILSLLLLFAAHSATAADRIMIAAAADLKVCMDELVAGFKREHADAVVEVAYGSSGNFKTQIEQGAPFDLFFSADSAYPRALHAAGLATAAPRVYAIGRIVLWSATLDARNFALADLIRADIQKVAIANPQHAPYGQRAEEALRAAGVWDAVQPKLVYGENIAQTAQFVQSGNAQVGIIALSLALNPQLAGKGGYALIPDSLHQPLEQAFVITQHGAGNALAGQFADYVQTPAVRALMARYGFALPGDAAT